MAVLYKRICFAEGRFKSNSYEIGEPRKIRENYPPELVPISPKDYLDYPRPLEGRTLEELAAVFHKTIKAYPFEMKDTTIRVQNLGVEILTFGEDGAEIVRPLTAQEMEEFARRLS